MKHYFRNPPALAAWLAQVRSAHKVAMTEAIDAAAAVVVTRAEQRLGSYAQDANPEVREISSTLQHTVVAHRSGMQVQVACEGGGRELELGSLRLQPHPFLMPALRASEEEIAHRVQRSLAEAMNKAGR